MKIKSAGGLIFIVGLVLAVIISVFGASSTPTWSIFVLAAIGLIVGLFNITSDEVQQFLIASIAFMISFSALSSIFTVLALGWGAVASFFGLLNIFVAPATAQ